MAQTSAATGPSSLGSGLRGFGAGVKAVLSGFSRLVREPELRKLALTPLAITVVAYVLMLVFGALYAGDVVGAVWARPESGWLMYVWYVIVPIVYFAFVVVLALLFVSLASVVSGPFYEKMVTRILADHGVTAKDAGVTKGAFFEVVRTVVFVTPAIVCALVGLIPVVGLPFIVVGTGISWLGFASIAINPALIATGHGVGVQLGYPFRSTMAMLGIGMVIGVSLIIPVIGLVSVPSAVIGATDLYARAIKTTPPTHPA